MRFLQREDRKITLHRKFCSVLILYACEVRGRKSTPACPGQHCGADCRPTRDLQWCVCVWPPWIFPSIFGHDNKYGKEFSSPQMKAKLEMRRMRSGWHSLQREHGVQAGQREQDGTAAECLSEGLAILSCPAPPACHTPANWAGKKKHIHNCCSVHLHNNELHPNGGADRCGCLHPPVQEQLPWKPLSGAMGPSRAVHHCCQLRAKARCSWVYRVTLGHAHPPLLPSV